MSAKSAIRAISYFAITFVAWFRVPVLQAPAYRLKSLRENCPVHPGGWMKTNQDVAEW
jgi:hypothetical protein